MLIAAAGVRLPAALNVTAEADTSSDAFSPQYTSGLQFPGTPSLPALKELARVYEAGTFQNHMPQLGAMYQPQHLLGLELFGRPPLPSKLKRLWLKFIHKAMYNKQHC